MREKWVECGWREGVIGGEGMGKMPGRDAAKEIYFAISFTKVYLGVRDLRQETDCDCDQVEAQIQGFKRFRTPTTEH